MKAIVYVVTTALVTAAYLAAGSAYLTRAPQVAEGFAHLGYPAYFLTLLGLWKIAGAATVALPGFPRLKEWAYAGMIINLSSAVFSHVASADAVTTLIPPVLLAALVLASWWLRPASRRLGDVHQAKTMPSPREPQVRMAA